jgi:hypothetical protein
MNLAIKPSAVEEVLPGCGSEPSAASCAISSTEAFGYRNRRHVIIESLQTWQSGQTRKAKR